MNDKIKIEGLYGTSRYHSWFEKKIDERGNVKYIGMGSRTDYDEKGKVVSYTKEPTGVVAFFT